MDYVKVTNKNDGQNYILRPQYTVVKKKNDHIIIGVPIKNLFSVACCLLFFC